MYLFLPSEADVYSKNTLIISLYAHVAHVTDKKTDMSLKAYRKVNIGRIVCLSDGQMNAHVLSAGYVSNFNAQLTPNMPMQRFYGCLPTQQHCREKPTRGRLVVAVENFCQ